MRKHRNRIMKLSALLLLSVALLLSAVGCATTPATSEENANAPTGSEVDTNIPEEQVTEPEEDPTEKQEEPTVQQEEPTVQVEEPTEVVPDIDYENLVTAGFTDYVIHGATTFCYHMPYVTLEGDGIEAFNAKVEADFMEMMNSMVYPGIQEYGDPTVGWVQYDWAVKGDILSIIVQREFYSYDWTEFDVYTVSIKDRAEATVEALYEVFGLTEESYYALVKETLEAYWAERKSQYPAEMPVEYIQTMIDDTLTEENIKKALPYINANGELCIVADIMTPAGAGHVLTRLNTVTKAGEGWLDCTENHPVG
ncbi:MAG: hypothetical protein IKT58_00365 [Oscillospiraceae bacterium]|nr:hypothetical protein [Oscillospiraceae bacterium]